MNEDRYIAAVEVGSSKIIVAVGIISPDGSLKVIATEQEKGLEAVRFGIIQNLEETSLRIARLIHRLEQRQALSNRKITGLFVGLSGRSLRSLATEVQLHLPDDTEIDDKIIENLRAEALRSAIDSSLEVVDAVPRIYRLGKYETLTPKGRVANNIKATFDLVVCRPELKRNLRRTISDKTGLKIEGFVVTSLASGHLMLSEDEKALGCMLVDFGAETTTVTIYKDGHLCYFATIPLGGRNITRDLTRLNLLEERAESTKIESGHAIAGPRQNSININGISTSDISNHITARAEEIVANVIEQIEYAELKEEDLKKIVCIGGGAKLDGMTELLSRESNISVRLGELPNYVSVEDSRIPTSDMLQLISLIYAGGTLSDCECLESSTVSELPATGTPHPAAAPEQPAVRTRTKTGGTGKWFRNVGSRLATLFSSPEDDSDDLIE